MARAYEFAAATYGWTARRVEAELTDEQLVMYFDAASERMEREATGRFESMMEAVRVGTIFAHDARQYAGWARRTKRSHGLTGEALEAALGAFARQFPEYVARG